MTLGRRRTCHILAQSHRRAMVKPPAMVDVTLLANGHELLNVANVAPGFIEKKITVV